MFKFIFLKTISSETRGKTSLNCKMSHQCYQQEKAKWSHTAQWTLLFLTRIKSGLLYLHQNSETRTKTHHQRKPKILRKNAYPKHHVQALTTPFAVQTLKTPRFLKQLCNCRFYFRESLSRWFLDMNQKYVQEPSRRSVSKIEPTNTNEKNRLIAT